MDHKQPLPKIRVAQVITRMDWGGSPDIVRLLCRHLDPQRFEFTLVMGNSAHLSLETKRFLTQYHPQVRIIYQLRRNLNFFWDLIAFIRLYRLFRREKFDIVHTHTAKAGALGRLAARLAGIPITVHTPHGHNFYGYFGAVGNRLVIWAERFLARCTTQFTVLTELERKDYVYYKVSPPNKITVVPSGIELQQLREVVADPQRIRARFSITPEDIVVGFVGRLESVKGPAYLVEAAPLIRRSHRQVKFLFVGDGSARAVLESRCNQLNISQHVVFTGWREDVPAILSILDIMVLPSVNEAVGRVLLEAGALGIPVVATYVGGIPEIVRDHETGFLVPPADPEQLALAVNTLIEDPDKRREFGAAARRWIDDKFASERMIQKITTLYQKLVNDARR